MTKIEVTCEICGKVVWREKREVKRSLKLGRRIFCSRHCTGIANIANLPDKPPTDHLPKGKLADEYSPFRKYFKLIRRRTKERHEEVNITLEDLKQQWEAQQGICPFTGWKLDIPRTTNWREHPITLRRASMDRIDSSQGYVPGNIRFVSVMANYCKNNFTDEDVLEFCRAVVTYQEKSGKK